MMTTNSNNRSRSMTLATDFHSSLRCLPSDFDLTIAICVTNVSGSYVGRAYSLGVSMDVNLATVFHSSLTSTRLQWRRMLAVM